MSRKYTKRVELVQADIIARALRRCERVNGADWRRALYIGFEISGMEYSWEARKKMRETLNLP